MIRKKTVVENETVRGICHEMKSLFDDTMTHPRRRNHTMEWFAYIVLRGYAERILDAYECDVADAVAEIARLKAAMKPVMELDMRRFGFAVGYGECFEAVYEAQLIYKEGEAK